MKKQCVSAVYPPIGFQVTGFFIHRSVMSDNQTIIFNVPEAWKKIIRSAGYSFAGFVKVAISEKMDRMNLK